MHNETVVRGWRQVFTSAEDGEDDVSFMKYNAEELETGLDAMFHDMSNTEQNGRWLRTWCV